MRIYCDACVLTHERGKGYAGIGIVFEDSHHSEVLPEKTDSTSAELFAVLRALELAKTRKEKILEIYTDNESVALCLSRFGSQFKKTKTLALECKIRKLEDKFKKVSYFYLPREENTFADILSRLAFGDF